MAILAECDICGNQHRVKEVLTGQTLRCNECGVLFVIAHGPSISAQTHLEEDGRLRPRDPAQPESIWPQLTAWLLAVVIMGALAGAIWVLMMLIRPAPQPRTTDASWNALTRCEFRSEPKTIHVAWEQPR